MTKIFLVLDLIKFCLIILGSEFVEDEYDICMQCKKEKLDEIKNVQFEYQKSNNQFFLLFLQKICLHTYVHTHIFTHIHLSIFLSTNISKNTSKYKDFLSKGWKLRTRRRAYKDFILIWKLIFVFQNFYSFFNMFIFFPISHSNIISSFKKIKKN